MLILKSYTGYVIFVSRVPREGNQDPHKLFSSVINDLNIIPGTLAMLAVSEY